MLGRNYRGILSASSRQMLALFTRFGASPVGRKPLLSFEFERNMWLWSTEVYDIPSALGLSETNGL